MKRRLFLKGSLASSVIAVAAAGGLIMPRQVLAAWPKEAFSAKSLGDAQSKLGLAAGTASDAVMLDVPDVAENGGAVPVKVETSLTDVKSISIFVEKNNQPLTANTVFQAGAKPYVSIRIKMSQTSNVIALVEAGGKSYTASKEVKVTVGGCA